MEENLLVLTIRLFPFWCLSKVACGSGKVDVVVVVVVYSKQSFLLESVGYLGGAGSSERGGSGGIIEAYVFRWKKDLGKDSIAFTNRGDEFKNSSLSRFERCGTVESERVSRLCFIWKILQNLSALSIFSTVFLCLVSKSCFCKWVMNLVGASSLYSAFCLMILSALFLLEIGMHLGGGMSVGRMKPVLDLVRFHTVC